MKKTILKIGGMTCSACSIGLEKYLNKQKGIINASVNLVLNQALIEYEDFLTIKDLEKFIKEAGYVSLGIYDGKDEVKNKGKTSLIIFSILALIVLYVAMGHMLKISVFYFDMVKNPKNYAVLLFVLAILFLIYGKDIFKSGIKNLLHGSPNMDSLVSLGVIASFGYSFYGLVLLLINKGNVENLYFESCSIIIYFIKLGRYIDGISKEKTKSALKELVSITPRTALLKNEKKEEEVTIDLVKKGDILICKAGMKIACDGKVTKGSAYVDQAFITGEAEPIKKNIGDDVIAGSINMDGYIEYEALKVGKDSTISEIVRLVVEATNTKAPIQRIADKVSSYFVYFIMVIALVTLFIYLLLGNSFGDSLVIFVSVLVVACPCSLGLATPLAMVVSEGVCAKEGILVKSSEVLENANKIDTVVFDKTGTLTYGFLKIFKIFNYSNLSLNELQHIQLLVLLKIIL